MSDPEKLAVEARLRRKITLTMKWISATQHLELWKSVRVQLNKFKQTYEKNTGKGNSITD